MVYSRFGYQQEISEANCGLTAWVPLKMTKWSPCHRMEFLKALLCVDVFVFLIFISNCEWSLMAGTIHAHERDSADTPREESAENLKTNSNLIVRSLMLALNGTLSHLFIKIFALTKALRPKCQFSESFTVVIRP